MFSYDKLWKCFPAALAALFLSVPAAAESGKFDIGVTGGWSKAETKTSAAGTPSVTEDDSGGSFGVVARYTAPVSDSGTFVGLAASWQTEGGLGETQTDDTFTGSGDAWSADLLVRVGHDYGSFAPYIAGGVSMLRYNYKLSDRNGRSAEDDQTHFGWKAAIGMDVELSGNWEMFVQGEYADYGEETYNFSPVLDGNLDSEGETLGIRLGLVYRF